ncbi:MAG TPA: sigma factor [Actinomycetota bacterium]|nr:sigma factor [Actinomycetota bacterium]
MSARAEVAAESGWRDLAELYRVHAPNGRRLAYLLTFDQALAEDLVQEAFARLVGRLAHLRDQAAFDAYLRRTIVNLSRKPPTSTCCGRSSKRGMHGSVGRRSSTSGGSTSASRRR